MRVLFICTGNTCRSPMAEGLATKNKSGAEFFSRGICAPDGAPASSSALRVMSARYGVDLSGHTAKTVTQNDAASADIIAVMSAAHAERLCLLFPECAGKVFMLRELAGCIGDIDDPFGGDLDSYARCAGDIMQCIEMIDFTKKLQTY